MRRPLRTHGSKHKLKSAKSLLIHMPPVKMKKRMKDVKVACFHRPMNMLTSTDMVEEPLINQTVMKLIKMMMI